MLEETAPDGTWSQNTLYAEFATRGANAQRAARQDMFATTRALRVGGIVGYARRVSLAPSMFFRDEIHRIILFALLPLAPCAGAAPPEIIASITGLNEFQVAFENSSIPKALLTRMGATSWHNGCPVPLSDLSLLTLSYWDFSGIPQNGQLIVNREVAPEVLDIFRNLFQHGFLVQRMSPVEDYDGSDDRSMAANNTSAFNCRDVTGKPGRFSNHSWGRAIDINPLTNPYVSHGLVLPPEGSRFLNRSKASPGSILANSFIVNLFRRHGWTWGGDWTDPDYQHFEKPEKSR